MKSKVYLKPVDPYNVSVITTKFDWQVIEVLRGIKSRRYYPERKENTIAVNDIDILKRRLFEYEFVEIEGPSRKYTIDITSEGFNVYPEPSTIDAKMSRIMWLKRPRDGYELYRILKEKGYNVELHDKVEGTDIEIPKAPKLRDFQEEGMDFLRENNYSGLLCLDTGLGKTILSIKTIQELGKGPVLIVGFSAFLYQWKKEFERHFGYGTAKVITAKTKKADRGKEFESGDIIITNYELLRTVKVKRHFELLILDECQRVKNWKTKTAQCISGIVAKRVLGLSATPVENNIMELYNITDQIRPAYFGTQRKFFNKYVISKRGSKFTYRNLDDVYRRLQGLMFRRSKEEVEDQLPRLITKTYEVPLTAKENSFYWKMLKAQENSGGAFMNAKAFASSSALKMDDVKISSKEKELLNLLDDFNERVVVFSFYKKEIYRLKELLKDKNVYTMTGDESSIEKDQQKEAWELDDEGILLMTEVGTHGLDLQKSKVVINMDLPWTHSRLKQRYGRIQRMDSEHESNLAINLVSSGTVDDRVLEIILDKKALSDASIDGETEIKKGFLEDLKKKGIVYGEV